MIGRPPGEVSLLDGYNPAMEQAFLTVDNQGGSAINGTFAGLPEWSPGGPLVWAGRVGFAASYVGGDGNEVKRDAKAAVV